MNKVTRQVRFQDTLDSGEGIMSQQECPLWGEITEIKVHWPTNCNAKVDVAVGHNTKWVLPSDVEKYIALDDTTQSWPFTGEVVEKGEKIWTRMQNRGTNPHTITVTVTVVGEEERAEREIPPPPAE